MKKLNFNDSTVANFSSDNDTALLEVDDVHHEGNLVKVNITVENYISLQSDNAPESHELTNISKLEMLSEDGNVIVFDSDETSFTVLITWHEYQPLKLTTRNYKVTGRELKFEIGEPYADKR